MRKRAAPSIREPGTLKRRGVYLGDTLGGKIVADLGGFWGTGDAIKKRRAAVIYKGLGSTPPLL